MITLENAFEHVKMLKLFPLPFKSWVTTFRSLPGLSARAGTMRFLTFLNLNRPLSFTSSGQMETAASGLSALRAAFAQMNPREPDGGPSNRSGRSVEHPGHPTQQTVSDTAKTVRNYLQSDLLFCFRHLNSFSAIHFSFATETRQVPRKFFRFPESNTRAIIDALLLSEHII